MDREDNATYLFAGKSDFPAHSESFWTSIFACFLLHLAERGEQLRLWRYEKLPRAPWYLRHQSAPTLDLSNLSLDDLCVEPSTSGNSRVFRLLAGVSINSAGFRPDVLLRLSRPGKTHRWILFENKTTEHLQMNQMENYPLLSKTLSEKGVENQICLLMSLGADNSFCKLVEKLQVELGHKFAIALWEDVLSSMAKCGFQCAGLPVQDWQKYSAALTRDADWN